MGCRSAPHPRSRNYRAGRLGERLAEAEPRRRGGGIESSREYHTDLIEAVHDGLLHRPSDPAGLHGWLSRGLDTTSLRIAFESSPEFFSNG